MRKTVKQLLREIDETPPIVVTNQEWDNWVSETFQEPTDEELEDMAKIYKPIDWTDIPF